MEELFFGLGLAGEELDVVDEEHVGVAVGALEVVQRSRAERVDELVGERLDGRVADRGAGAERADVVADRVQEVRLAEPGRGVEEQRVVGLARELGDRQRGRMREPVAVADDELLEGEPRVERVVAVLGLLRRAGGLGAAAGVPW